MLSISVRIRFHYIASCPQRVAVETLKAAQLQTNKKNGRGIMQFSFCTLQLLPIKLITSSTMFDADT